MGQDNPPPRKRGSFEQVTSKGLAELIGMIISDSARTARLILLISITLIITTLTIIGVIIGVTVASRAAIESAEALLPIAISTGTATLGTATGLIAAYRSRRHRERSLENLEQSLLQRNSKDVIADDGNG